MGELIAWIMGLLLVLEYGLAASTVAVGWSGYLVSLLHDLNIDIPPPLTAAPGVAIKDAAGVVIADRPLDELVPLYRDPGSDMPVTQYNMKYVENAGLVKFDFLGLKTLTVIAKSQDLIRARHIEIDVANQDFGDAGTFRMLARGESSGVFQLESSGMRDLLRKMRPDRIERYQAQATIQVQVRDVAVLERVYATVLASQPSAIGQVYFQLEPDNVAKTNLANEAVRDAARRR
jgi:hypothetical protein